MADAFSVRVTFGIPEGAETPNLAEFEGVTASPAPVLERDAFLPLIVLLAVVVPPGLALLTRVVDEVVHGWKDHGVLIDATGEAPVVKPMPGIPYGTIVVISKDGEQATRSDLAKDDLSKYIGAAVTALSGGATADAAKASADKAVPAKPAK